MDLTKNEKIQYRFKAVAGFRDVEIYNRFTARWVTLRFDHNMSDSEFKDQFVGLNDVLEIPYERREDLGKKGPQPLYRWGLRVEAPKVGSQ